MFVRLSIDDLADRLDEVLLRRVAEGERFLLYLDGEPACILAPDTPLRQFLDAPPAGSDDSS